MLGDAGIEIVGADRDDDQVRIVVALVPLHRARRIGDREIVERWQLQFVGPVVPAAHEPPAAVADQLHLRVERTCGEHAVRESRVPPVRRVLVAGAPLHVGTARDGIAQHEHAPLGQHRCGKKPAVGREARDGRHAQPRLAAMHEFHLVRTGRRILEHVVAL